MCAGRAQVRQGTWRTNADLTQYHSFTDEAVAAITSIPYMNL